MSKELLRIEFRYKDKPDSTGSTHRNKFITIGIYDTLEEAVKIGNKLLTEVLIKHFHIRKDDRFSVNGFLGSPERLVTNCCYPTKGITYFAKIIKLDFDNLEDTIDNILDSAYRYIEYRSKETEDD